MFEEEIVIDDTTIVTEEVAVEPTEGETAEAKAARLEEANKKLFERAKKAEEVARTLKATVKPINNPEKPEVAKEFESRMSKLELSEKKRQFGFKNGLSPEETDKLFKFAGDEDPNVALKDDFFQAGLKTFRQKQSVANAIPSSSNRARAVVEGKSFADMSEDDRQKNWGKITGAAK